MESQEDKGLAHNKGVRSRYSSETDPHPVNCVIYDSITALIDGWCERRALAALAIVLPAWPPFGHTDQWYELRKALRSARARGRLLDDEKAKVGEILGKLDQLLTWPPPQRET